MDFPEHFCQRGHRSHNRGHLGMDAEKIAMNEREPFPASRAPAKGSSQPPTIITIVHECMKLVDLQVQLVQMDFAEFWKRSQIALALLTIASALLLGSLPIALMALAAWLETGCGWSKEFSLACTAAIALSVALTSSGLAIVRLKHAVAPLSRNQEELIANLQWMRKLLHQDDVDNTPSQ